MEIPGLFIKTSLTVMGSAADKQRHTDAGAIGHIILLDICIIHHFISRLLLPISEEHGN